MGIWSNLSHGLVGYSDSNISPTRQPCRRTPQTNMWLTDFFYSRPLKMGRIGCPETSVNNYHHSLPNNPEGRSSLLLRGGSLKSHKAIALHIQYSEPPTDTKRDVTFSDKLHIDNDSPSYEMNRKSACIQGHSDVTTRTNRWCRWRWRDIITTASLETPPGE